MNRLHRLTTLALLALLACSSTLFGQQLPDMATAIEQAINPIFLIDAVTGEVLLANPSAQRFFSDGAPEGAPLSVDALLDLAPSSITDLHGTVVTLGDPPSHQMVSILPVGEAARAYYALMLTTWYAQQRLPERNRLL